VSLPDPIPQLTAVSVNYDFFRTGTGDGSAVYSTADGKDVITISHQSKNRNRTIVRLDRSKIAANPFDAALNQAYSLSTYQVFDWPKLGVTSSEVANLATLLNNFVSAGTPTNYRQRILQGES
jgi:hypothetical protein